ncbi:MAG: potassium transporter TrkG [Dysosmobacter sp.]
MPLYRTFSDSLRQAAFQVASAISTTGFYYGGLHSVWTPLSTVPLLGLMFVGGCAGSTAGGLKVSR